MRGLVTATVKRNVSVASLIIFIDGVSLRSEIRVNTVKSEDLGSIVLKAP